MTPLCFRGQLGPEPFNSKTQVRPAFTLDCKDLLLQLLLDVAECCKVVHPEHVVLRGRRANGVQLLPGSGILESISHLWQRES